MRISGKAFALAGAVIVASVALAPAHAGSFGQQWRPAAYAPAPQQAYRRVANMPAFRPHGSLSSPRHGYGRSTSRRAVTAPAYATRLANRPRTAYRPTRPARRAAYRGQPMDTRSGRPVAYAAPSMAYPPIAYPAAQVAYPPPAPWTHMPVWANPFAQMARPWQYPAARYSRQFVSRPTERRRLSAAGDHRYYRPVAAPVGAARGMTRPAPAFAGGAPAWRPSAAPTVARTAYAPRTVASYRPIAMRPAYVSRTTAAGMPRDTWRPAPLHRASVQAAAGREFRPAGYGRGATLAQRAARGGADRLPGWATTYDSPLGASTCDWCGGS